MEFIINVNGKDTLFYRDIISYDDLVKMVDGNKELVYTITYSGGKNNIKGILSKNQSININDRMIFNISMTSNA